MKTTETQTSRSSQPDGFFKRLFKRLDEKMKKKAEAQASQGSCCSGSDNKGDKCC